MAAWQAVSREPGGENPLPDLLAGEPEIVAYLPAERVQALMTAGDYVGDAPQRARALAARIRETLAADA
jgi:adenylosuccinate lyase